MNGSRTPRTSRTVVLAWALAMLLAVTVTSWAVSMIGRPPDASHDRVLNASDVAAALAIQSAVPIAAPPAVEPTVAPVPSPSSPSPTAVPPLAAPATSGPGPLDAPPAAPPVAPPAGPTEVARTWDVDGGQVGASCSGAAISLLYATPVDGWTVAVEDATADGFEVAFRQGGSRTVLHASCVQGVPTQEVDNDD